MNRMIIIIMIVLFATASLTLSGTTSEGGCYRISNLRVTNAPERKNDGSNWDTVCGEADIYIECFVREADGSVIQGFITDHKQDSGTCATWDIEPVLPIWEIGAPGESYVVFIVHDKDAFSDDFMDSGSIDVTELSVFQPDTVICDRNTRITFDLEYLLDK